MEAAGKRYITYGSRTDTFRIWNLADLHLGNRGVSKSKLAADIEAIRADPFSFWLGGGDYADYISYKDKRFDPETVDPDVLEVCDMGTLGKSLTMTVRNLLRPIAHKCLGLAFGNHEGKYMLQQEQGDLHAWLCKELDVPNLRYSAMMDLVFCRTTGVRTPRLYRTAPTKLSDHYILKIFVHHGSGAATTKGTKANSLERWAKRTTARLTFIGHCHDALAVPLIQLDTNRECTEIVERKKLALMSGSYLRTYASGQTGYGEIRGYEPSILGAVWARYKPDTDELTSEVRA